MMTKCDMCGTKIENGECSCGTWTDPAQNADNPMRKALEQFNEMKQLTCTGDAPHLGCAMVMFRGDYKDCKTVENFILQMKGRPFYEKGS